MFNKVLAISALSLTAFLGTAVVAQSASAAGTGVLGKYDTDNDKTLDLNEAKAAAGAHFDKLDKDSDGQLEGAEVKGLLSDKAFKAADPDSDGKLSKDEYLALVEKVFNKVDSDHDGSIDAQELKSKKAHLLKHLLG